MARFTIEIETVDATPAEWVDALAKVRGLPEFELLSEDPVTRTDVEAAACEASVAFLELAHSYADGLDGGPQPRPDELRDISESIKALTCSAYSAMRLVGGAK